MFAGSAIPILTYHNVGAAQGLRRNVGLYVSVKEFERQMRALSALGFRGVSLGAGLPYLRGERSGRIAIITFDDGYRDNLTNALPILTRHRFSATCYLVSRFLGTYNQWDSERLQAQKSLMDQDEVRTWCAAGMEIGAHTCTHPRLGELSLAQKTEEIAQSKSDLESLFNARIDHFCYPYGNYDAECVEVVKQAGYTSAVTTARGRARPHDDLHQLRRVSVKGSRSFLRFLMCLLTPLQDKRLPAVP